MLELKLNNHPKKQQDEFETEFKRIYSDLYPDETTLIKAISFYRKQFPYLQFPDVDLDPTLRIEKMRYFLKEKTLSDYEKKVPETRSDYLFSDIKEIIQDDTIDLVHLSPAVISGVSENSVYKENWKTNVGKCISGCRKNGINIGNFIKVLWKGGMAYLDALEEGVIQYDSKTFETNRGQLSYNFPIIVITNSLEYGTMLGEYHNFLNEKGIGTFQTDKKPKIPGFDFIGKLFPEDRDGFILDYLSFF